MSLVVSGVSHHTSNVALRDRLAFSEESLPGALSALRDRIADAGAVILSTCNRSEIYLNGTGESADLHHEIRGFISSWHGVPEEELSGALYAYHDREAVGHLFRVASSLDSMVVGEEQILGQVHDAYITAHREQATDKVMNALFQKAFSVAKKVRSQTRISAGKVSISSVAVDLAVSIFMDLSGETVLVIGSGEMGELTLKHLVEKGVGHVIVANRSREKAEALARTFNGESVALEDLDQVLARADIVISSTGAPGVVLEAEQVQAALRQRSQKPMFLIDIAAPRDIDAAANELDNVYLYNIDDLQEVADKNIEARRHEVDRCLELVDIGTDQFCKWLRSLAAEPTIVSLSKELNAVRERELEKTLARLRNLSDKDREEIEYLTKRIVNNILQRPLTQIKEEVHDADQLGVLQMVRRLFGLKEGT
ncbi:MAG: glutamyl-tRNA reductase [Candidatus Hydrogenedentes bacterium]|nr:glutamyl-tRNA reductase [Candidatus Hydrogenedentota bacterium]